MPALRYSPEESLRIARSVARDVKARAAGEPFVRKDDPRRAERELGAFALRWVLAILQEMGAMRAPGEVHDLDALKARLGVVPRYDRYFAALIRKLEAEGLVTVQGAVIETTARVRGYALAAVEEQVAEFRRGFEERHPACAGLLGFMACCLSRFAEIITGRIDAADVVFQDGSMDVFARVFGGDAVSDYFNRIVADAVRSAILRVRESPGAPKVRIVEIGAGTGGTTAAILEAVQPLSDAAELCFSDISPSFIRHARRRFAQTCPWLDYKLLDIEEDLAAQGFEPRSFDVVVAANVLHDTRDIEHTLRQTRRLLKPGGLLVLDEFTAAKTCLFFSGALLHGYWLFEDPDRRLQDSCLLSVPQWRTVLERTGFEVLESFALPTQRPDAKCSQSVMLCAASWSEESEVEERSSAAAWPEKSAIIGRCIEQEILAILGEERSSAYSARRPLMEMGLDSIELVELKALVRQRFDVKLPPAFLFEHETQEKMTKALAAVVPDEQIRELRAQEPVEPPAAPHREAEEGAIAIVGVACRFPGGVVSPETFWKLLERGEHGIVPMPPGRWQWPPFVDPQGRHKGIDRGGFLERIDEFDAWFFRTSPREAEWMDPQQRLLLELSWEAMEDGGCRPSQLSGRRIGVFVGVCQSDYRDVLVASSESAEAYVGSGTAFAMLSNRLSYFYNLKGPSLTVDTACSSSLFALHDAVTAMRSGECELALVGAVNLICSPTISIAYYEAGMLSPTGRCQTFDEAADGYVRGEGGAVLLLKPLAKALEDGDSIYGLVRGTAVNHGGQATTLTAPKPDAQADVIEAAWLAAGISPDSAGYIETHGTGTKLGDPVEVSGLTEAFRRLHRAHGKSWPAKPHCGLGSVKTNVGHLEGAAGLAGLLKILLSFRHGQIPGTLNFRRLNPEIELEGSPFYVVERHREWPRLHDETGRELPRRAGVSSFGFGGANAHVVLEEWIPGARAAVADDGYHLVSLSARTQEELNGRARRLLEFLETFDGCDVRRALDGLKGILRRRFGLEETATADLEWEELGWGAMETLLFLSDVEEAHGIRLHSRSLVECSTLRSLAERIAGAGATGRSSAESSGPGVRLDEVAYTLQVGREPMAERVAFLVRRLEDLVSALRRYAAGDRELPGCYCGYSMPAHGGERQDLETSIARRDLQQLASLWVRGAEIDWERLYPAVRPRRVHLPTYPFARQRYWASRARAPRPAGELRRAAGVKVRLEGYRFSASLTGDELFLTDHVIQGRRLLPAVALLEMARAALERTSGPGGAWLKDLAWIRPLEIDGRPAQVHLRLTPENGGDLSLEIYSGEEPEVFHGQGRVGLHASAEAPVVDIAAVRARCTREIRSGEDFYRALAAMGYGYGPAQRAVDALYVGSDELLARLILPPFLADTREEFVLHPAMADSAVQATLGFSLVDGVDAIGPALPFELRSAEIFGACAPVMWASVQRRNGVFDIDLCDETGRISARFRGLAMRPAEPRSVGELMLAPIWEPVQIEVRETRGRTAIVGGSHRQWSPILERLSEAWPLALAPEDGIEAMARKIASWGEIEHVLWIVPDDRPGSMADDSLIAAQQTGVVFGFRLIKALLGEGYGERPLAWTVITTATQAIHAGETLSPAHASVHGLIGAMAKEYPDWDVRLLDLPGSGEWPWGDVLAMAGDPHGDPLAYRDRRWFRQRLVPYRPAVEEAAPYHPGGVYVVIGGAGGVGEAWSEALLRRTPAQIVWIGRRPKDASLQARLDRLAELGPAPLYIAADAADREQLEAARDEIKAKFGRIDGVVHAAIVLHDQSLAGLSEEGLEAGLSPKIDVCVRLAQVFAGEPLDFVLFFSSMLSFLKWPGQSNYAAGCTFKDAFASRLAAEWPCRVRTINWGYWGSVGAAASDRHRSFMGRKGFGSIEPPGAMEALDRLLSGPVPQLMYLKTTTPSALAEVDVDLETGISHNGDPLPSVELDAGADGDWRLPREWSVANQEIEESLAGLLSAQLRSARLLDEPAPERFARWMERSRAELEARGLLGRPAADPQSAWQSWGRLKERWSQDAGWRAQMELAEAAVLALPDILTGRRAATDVLLGDLLAGSTPVSEVYRQGAVTRFCNEALAHAVSRYVEERRRRDPGCRIRILEIGAGTGATSELVFEALSAQEGGIREYAFTDISMAFLAVAKKSLRSRPDYLTYRTFDVEAPPEAQGIAPGSYDLAIATNVLHATKDIRRTLRNAKAVLRTNGLLILNEIATNSLFHHLTFGLLDGWWLFADRELRAPGGPALRPDTWRAVLEQEGFRSVRFPAQAAHGAGQQVVVAESDGLVRQRLAPQVPSRRPEHPAHEAPGNGRGTPIQDLAAGPAAIAEIMGRPRDAAIGYLLGHLRLKVAETLGVAPATLESRSRPFADALLGEFGMDSLSSNSLRNTLRRDLGVDVTVQQIISEKVRFIVGDLYEQLLLRHVTGSPRQAGEETETFVF